MKTLFTVNFLLSLSVIGLVVVLHMQPTHKDFVYQVCQSERIHGIMYRGTCRNVQEQFGVEYLCDEDTSSISDKCHVE